jgi:signal transduction histidine kinase
MPFKTPLDYSLEDLIDVVLVQRLQEKLFVLFPVHSAIKDIDGKLLTVVGEQDVCRDFHQLNPESHQACIKSDQSINRQFAPTDKGVSYACPHGLYDCVRPIFIRDQHVGNFFVGQFIIGTPDVELYKIQAKKYGFEEQMYLEAMQKVPVWNEEKLNHFLDFIQDFVEMIAEMGYKNFMEHKTNVILEKTSLELRNSKDKAEESDRLKSAFLANVSHEIRTPMNGILGFAELLRSPNLSGEEQQEYIKIIERSGARLLSTINDIIDISQIEAGEVEVRIMPVMLKDELSFLYDFYKQKTDYKGLQLVYNPQVDDTTLFCTDKGHLNAILSNLLSNAIKFTSQGSIEFGYTRQNENVQFFVSDTGIGIREDDFKLIFQRFRQAHEGNTRSYEGSGLGLAITKAFVEKLGGSIRVESKLGSGSTFYVDLPEHPISGTTAPHEEAFSADVMEHQLRNLKIIVAEDDESSEMFINIILQSFSMQVLNARSGFEVVELTRENPDVDLILMDVQMPDLNGYEATQEIRKFNKDVIIIAQTAHAFSDDKTKAINAGCNDYLTKPIEINNLMGAIRKYF